jgi:hypothetical protein
MNLTSFIAMRQEIFLLTIILLLIVGEIFIPKNKNLQWQKLAASRQYCF